MPIPIDYFQPLSFQQANPLLAGIQAGEQIYGQGVKNAYLGKTLAQQLQAMQLQNAARQAGLPYVGPQAAATLSQTQAQTPLLQSEAARNQAAIPLLGAQAQQARAQAGMLGEQRALLAGEIPSLIARSQGSVFTDPIMQRAFELSQAQRAGIAPALQSFGINVPGAANTPISEQAASSGGLAPISGAATTATPGGTPNMFGGNPSQNYGLFGSPYNPIQLQGLLAQAKTGGTTGITQYNTAQADAAKAGDLGIQLKNLTDQFQKAYAKTDLKGGALGMLPSHFSSAAQTADNASQNMAGLVAKMIAGGRVTNYEMQYVANMKPNRGMNPEAAREVSDFLKQKSIRMQEEAPFLNAARQQGIDVQTAQALWNSYNNQRPVYDFDQNKPNTQFQNSWKDYLTPQAVQAVKNGQGYVPLPAFSSKAAFQNWLRTITPADKQAVIMELRGNQQ